MSPASDQHGQDYAERVFLYALQALPSSEVAVAGGHIAGCAECRQEMETLRPIIDSFASWPTDVLRPPVPLWERLAQRIAAETGGEPMLPSPQRWAEPEWNEAAPGISYKLLATDTERNASACWCASLRAPTIHPTAMATLKSCICFTVS